MNFIKKIFNHVLLDEFAYVLITISFLFVTSTYKGITDPKEKLSYALVIILVIILYIIIRVIKNSSERMEVEKEKRKEEASIRELAKANTVFVQFKGNRLENGSYKDTAYEVSEKAVKEAIDRIIIVSDYSPAREDLDVTVIRQKYYQAIEDVLDKKLSEKRDVPFKYIRYMQREPQKFISIRDKGGVIDIYDLVDGDVQAFCHCKRVLEKFKNKANIELELYVTVNIPSLPSMLIIDKDKLLFTIPERKKGNKLETAGVLNFKDYSPEGTALVDKFSKIVETLPKDNGKEVVKIESIGNFKEPSWKKWLHFFK